MKKFVFRRILPVILAFSVTTSILVVPARAFTVTEAISVVQALLSTAESIERFRKEVVEHLPGHVPGLPLRRVPSGGPARQRRPGSGDLYPAQGL